MKDEFTIINARVAMQFKVNEQRFQTHPQEELREALLEGRVVLSDGDNYAPAEWNEENPFFKNQADGYDFSLGVHKVSVTKEE